MLEFSLCMAYYDIQENLLIDCNGKLKLGPCSFEIRKFKASHLINCIIAFEMP